MELPDSGGTFYSSINIYFMRKKLSAVRLRLSCLCILLDVLLVALVAVQPIYGRLQYRRTTVVSVSAASDHLVSNRKRVERLLYFLNRYMADI